jgi:hypothetical protein
LERIGMVFFRSTTPCMSESSFKKSPRLSVNSMGNPTSRKEKKVYHIQLSYQWCGGTRQRRKKSVKTGLKRLPPTSVPRRGDAEMNVAQGIPSSPRGVWKSRSRKSCAPERPD